MTQVLSVGTDEPNPKPPEKAVTISFSLRRDAAIELHKVAVREGITMHQAARRLLLEKLSV